MGVNDAIETRGGETTETGAGDQGMMFGYACDETPELMPLAISLSHKLCKKLAELRKDKTLTYLRPDGKAQVTVEYDGDKPIRVDTVVISTQHAADVTLETIRRDMMHYVIPAVIPAELLDENTKYFINPHRTFRGRRSSGRQRSDRTEDHRRHLRRHSSSRRRRIQRQGSDEG